MGLFDKIKTFVGAHGCKVEITELERQAPGNCTFPVRDSVFKGKFRVTASKPCTVLAHKVDVVIVKDNGDQPSDEEVVASCVHDADNQVIGLGYEWPYDMAAGDVKADGFCITDVDLPATLAKLGITSLKEAATRKDVTFSIRVTVDVKGTPMDAGVNQAFQISV